MFIHQIDELVSKEAANYILNEGPDLSWMYLEYTDDMGHNFGNSPQMTDGVQKADVQVGRVWEAIKFREKEYPEDWLLVITTDHGREADGFGHGGQSERERAIWIATNSKQTNTHFGQMPGMVDILPSMAYHLDITIPKKIALELDGTPFIGPVQATKLKAKEVDGKLILTWKCLSKGKSGRVWLSTTNNFKYGGLDNYLLMDEVDLDTEQAEFDLHGIESGMYKVVLETDSGYLNYWVMN